MLDVDFYRLYNGLWARDLMPCLCCVFAVIFNIFTKVCRVFLPFFAVIFYCPYRPTAAKITRLLSREANLGRVYIDDVENAGDKRPNTEQRYGEIDCMTVADLREKTEYSSTDKV